jgi:hypothetical protein
MGSFSMPASLSSIGLISVSACTAKLKNTQAQINHFFIISFPKLRRQAAWVYCYWQTATAFLRE